MGQEYSTQQQSVLAYQEQARLRYLQAQRQVPAYAYSAASLDRQEEQLRQQQRQAQAQRQAQQYQQRQSVYLYYQYSSSGYFSKLAGMVGMGGGAQSSGGRGRGDADDVIDVTPSQHYRQGSYSQISSTSNVMYQELDDLLRQLAALPQFHPLIKGSIDQNVLKDLFKNRYSSLNELDALENRSLVEICADFYTQAMHYCRDVCVKQDNVISTIRTCQLKTNDATQDLVQRSDKLKKLAGYLRDVDRLARYVDYSRYAVEGIIEYLQTLEALLPAYVRRNISTPLFVSADIRPPSTASSFFAAGEQRTFS